YLLNHSVKHLVKLEPQCEELIYVEPEAESIAFSWLCQLLFCIRFRYKFTHALSSANISKE
ncbi:MAG: hypothetical protein AAFR37_14525, partial [Cyanobacteria bacterium J06628_3]